MIQIEESNPSFESCFDCIHSDDSEEMCILRGCIHAVAQLKECYVPKQPTIEPQQRWIPCSERLPEEDHWLGGSGKQFSDNVLISIVNRDDEDAWVQVSQTIDGTWALELPRYCKVIAWMPLPEPYAERRTDEQTD